MSGAAGGWRRLVRACAFVGLLAMLDRAVAAEPSTAPAAGRQRVAFTEPHPASGLAEYCRRTRQSPAAYTREGTGHQYALADESFELRVPAACTADNPHGLLVWISPGRSDLPREWFPVLERHKLIWICPNNAGNDRHVLVRIGLALDAVHNARSAYPIDPTRVHIAGFSGGGRVSSIVALTYPDVFTGAACMMGCNFYRPLPAGDGKFFRAGAARPIEAIFTQARRLPLVLLTGEHDGNRPQTKASFQAFQKDRFAHVSYIEVPGIGHDMPEAYWLDQCLAALDTAVTQRPAARPTSAPTSRPRTGAGARSK